MYLGSFLLCKRLSEVTAKHSIAVKSRLSVRLSVMLVNCGRMYMYLVCHQFAIMISLFVSRRFSIFNLVLREHPKFVRNSGGVLLLTETLHCLTL